MQSTRGITVRECLACASWNSLRVVVFAGFMWCSSAGAESLGRLGATYPIGETDAQKYLEAKIFKHVKSPQALQEEARKSITDFLSNLPVVAGISRVEKNHTRYMDAIHVAERDVFDEKGAVLVKAGTRIELLRHTQMDALVFILDGRDPRQVLMLQRLWRANYKVHPLLVAGSHTQLSRRFRRSFYYDYNGAISARFGVNKVPSIVGQDGNRIRIEELKP